MEPTYDFDRIKPRNIVEEMQDSFIDYSMSVIVSRALPDVRDGLKPVHRRILFAMDELGLEPSKPYKKSSRIVGETMGKYHPHGESIYGSMVRMAQDFAMRYPLVDGHGNFGSMDGDGAAASRYTEARLARLSMEMLTDIDKDTVNFAPNYDDQETEPTVLPARFPNLLVNGSVGIAVGMATNIPPHNLTDVIGAVLHRINDQQNDRETPIEELIDIVKAPDYPTGGAILGTANVRNAYYTGRGRVVVRSEATIEPMGSGREQIRVTAIPYQVNKANLIIKIAELVKDKKIDGISDVRDESNREGVRIIIELRKDANANVILNQLYKMSPLQESYGIIMLALVNGEPKVLNLSEMIEHYITHQKEVITRRTRFELDKAERRAHILEGLLKALDHIDEIIALIRSSQDAAEARAKLIERFQFSEVQAQAIVEMRLRALTGLEKERLEKEYAELQVLIAELTRILGDMKYLLEVLKGELSAIQTKFGDERRTAILHDPGEILTEDLIEEGEFAVTLSHLNYIKRIPLDTYRSQARGGRGVVGMQTRDEDVVKDLFVAHSHDHILFFTNYGRAYHLRTFEIPEAGRQAMGMAIVNLLNLNPGETIAAMIPVSRDEWDGYLVMVTQNGIIMRSQLSAYAKINKSGLNAISIRDDDKLITALRSDGNREIFMATACGRGIRFAESDVRVTGRGAFGVRGMKLRVGDKIVGATMADGQVLLVSENGIGKCIPLESCRGQGRAGLGIIVYKLTERSGPVIGVEAVHENDELMLINSEGVIIRMRVADISVQGRYASGVKLINMNDGVTVVGMAKIPESYVGEVDVEEEE